MFADEEDLGVEEELVEEDWEDGEEWNQAQPQSNRWRYFLIVLDR